MGRLRERADGRNGDLNVLGPFIPFASPLEAGWVREETTALVTDETGFASTTITQAKVASHAFRCVLDVFQQEDVGLVVRLNDEL